MDVVFTTFSPPLWTILLKMDIMWRGFCQGFTKGENNKWGSEQFYQDWTHLPLSNSTIDLFLLETVRVSLNGDSSSLSPMKSHPLLTTGWLWSQEIWLPSFKYNGQSYVQLLCLFFYQNINLTKFDCILFSTLYKFIYNYVNSLAL